MDKYNVQYVPVDKIIEAVECVYYSKNPNITKSVISSYLGTNDEYARRALIMAEQLGFLIKDNRTIKLSGSNDIVKADKNQKPVIFRKYLQRFEPFILFLTFLSKGNFVEDAIRKVKAVYSLKLSNDNLRLSFVSLGSYCNLLEYNSKDNSLKLNFPTDNLSAEYLKSLVESLDSDIKTRIYLAGKLTEEAFSYLNTEEVEFLVKSLQLHERDPRNSIDDAGRAMEDFLRRIATDNGYDVANKSGISELAQIIGGGSTKLIHTKHLHICNCLGAIRVAAAHSKDKSTMESWKINADMAIEVILLIISTIRSIYYFVYNQQQVM